LDIPRFTTKLKAKQVPHGRQRGFLGTANRFLFILSDQCHANLALTSTYLYRLIPIATPVLIARR
jgi:hypothetical protein